MKKQWYTFLAVLATTALVSCGGNPDSSSAGTSSSESASASTSSSASSESSSESSSTSAEKTLEITQNKDTFALGQSYLGEIVPTLVYGGSDVSAKTTRWSIELSDGTHTFDGFTAISASGTFTVTAKYKLSNTKFVTSNSLQVTVAAKDVPTDKGYAQAADYFSDDATVLKLKKEQSAQCYPSVGSPKLLVVPFQFSDAPYSDTQLTKINKGFFGTSEETSWESLNSFYKKSSYGRLDIKGTLTKAFTATTVDGSATITATNYGAITAKEALSASDFTTYGESWNVSWLAVEEITAAIKAGTLLDSDGNTINVKDYDADGDGFIDAIWVVYSYPFSVSNTSVWWAWTHHDWVHRDAGNVDSPVPFNLCWASYSFLSRGYYNDGIDIDVHTMVHETGHLMGLNDYYNTDSMSAGTYEGASGGVDMMDQNVGDHSISSKMQFNWVKPYTADGTQDAFKITLKPFESSGDALILKNPSLSWEASPYQEYVAFTYYTPTGLNAKDSTVYPEYATTGIGTYDKSGLTVHHIDNRLINQTGVLNSETGKVEYDTNYTSTIAKGNSKEGEGYSYTWIGASNSPSRSYRLTDVDLKANSAHREVSLVASCGNNIFQNLTSSSALYKAYAISNEDNVLYTPTGYNTFSTERCSSVFVGSGTAGKMNDGNSLGWTVSVSAMDANGLTLLVAKN